ncbi:DUF4817 domain-containing protein [Trichonephila clavipes]|nr:DUF4817 domain-containing protein [Trichonephila clavipes]
MAKRLTIVRPLPIISTPFDISIDCELPTSLQDEQRFPQLRLNNSFPITVEQSNYQLSHRFCRATVLERPPGQSRAGDRPPRGYHSEMFSADFVIIDLRSSCTGILELEYVGECDEAHFWLNGYVSKQNCRIWSEANPQVYVETPLHSEKLTVWCALWAGGIIGPYFFKSDEGHNELWFQQEGATCHTARATIDLLKDLISRFGPVNWPPRSCDLTPLDYFLWGYVKSLVYADKLQTLDHLGDNIRRVIADIRPQMSEKAIENWTSRLDYIRASRGSPIPDIIFKM